MEDGQCWCARIVVYRSAKSKTPIGEYFSIFDARDGLPYLDTSATWNRTPLTDGRIGKGDIDEVEYDWVETLRQLERKHPKCKRFYEMQSRDREKYGIVGEEPTEPAPPLAPIFVYETLNFCGVKSFETPAPRPVSKPSAPPTPPTIQPTPPTPEPTQTVTTGGWSEEYEVFSATKNGVRFTKNPEVKYTYDGGKDLTKARFLKISYQWMQEHIDGGTITDEILKNII